MQMVQKLLSRFGAAESKRLTAASLQALLIKLGSAGLSFVMFIALARVMTAEGFSIFGTLFSLATLCAVIGSLGLRNSVIRFGTQYDELGEDNLRRGVMQWSYLFVLVGTIIAALGGVIVGWLAPQIPNTGSILLGIAILTLGIGFSDFQNRSLRVNAPVWLALTPKEIVWRALICVFAGVSILALGQQVGEAAPWVWLVGVSLIGVVIVQWLLYERLFPEKSLRGPREVRGREWLLESLGPWTSQIVNAGNANLSVFFVGMILDIAKAGPYFASLRVAQLLNLFSMAIEVALTPAISRAAAVEDWPKLQRLCSLSAALASVFSLVTATALILLADFLLGLFGPGMPQATDALIVLAVGFLINTLAGPTAPLLLMTGHGSKLALFQFSGAVIGLLAMPFAISAWGMIGAAVCTAGTTVCWNIAAWLYARQVLGIDPTIVSLVYPVRNRLKRPDTKGGST